MGAAVDDLAVIHDEDHVRVHDGGNALGDDDLRGLGDVGLEARTNQRVGLRVDGAGGVVEDEDLRLLEKGAGDAQSLLLAAGDVGAALLDMCLISLGEGFNKIICLRQFAGFNQLLVRGVFVAPAQVLGDGAGEEQVFLQHHGHGVSERVGVVLAHVHAADLHAALGHVVEPRNELDEGRLARARAAQDADGGAGGDVQVDVRQGVLLGVGGVLEGHVLKIDAAVLHGFDGVGGADKGRLLGQHLADALGRLGGDGDHDIDEGEHHQAHEHLYAVGHHGGDLAHVDDGAAARDHKARAHGEDEDHVEVHAKLHDGGVHGDDALGLGKVFAYAVGRRAELLLFVVLTCKALDHAHGAHVFLDGFVELVVLTEDRAEGRHGVFGNHQQAPHHHRHHYHKGEGQLAAHDEGHDDGKQEHQRRAHGGADDHHEGHLHVCHVGGHARDQGGRGKAVDVFKGEALHAHEHVLSEVAGKAGGGVGAGARRHRPAQERQYRHQRKLPAQGRDIRKRRAGLDHVDHVGGVEGDKYLEEDLPHNDYQGEQRGLFVLAQTRGKGFDHAAHHILSPDSVTVYCSCLRRGKSSGWL